MKVSKTLLQQLEQLRPTARPVAKGSHRTAHTRGTMNKTERAYSHHLDARILAGEVREYWFERITLLLAGDTRYTPDFMVQLVDGTLEMHEVKGFWEDDARAKIKIAADQYPFRFIAATKAGCEPTVPARANVSPSDRLTYSEGSASGMA